ncbi:MAG: T9SS type A sorting domain-containing protein [Niastella sp.]|nr:T9SS type A sorting domain-containing protein [Niastella sp.]
MKHLYKFCTACLLLVCVLTNQQGIAQLPAPTHTPRTVNINSNCGGYYEYLPQGYDAAGSQRYPLLVYMHGDGDRGSGSQTDLAKLLTKALPKLINDGQFPSSITSNGQAFKFIVISPQLKLWPQSGPAGAADVAAVLAYVKGHYKVDTNRIYLTGMSMGGGITWEYAGSNINAAQKLAAIVPICGASSPQTPIANVIANGDVPVWATHNQADDAVPVNNTNGYVSFINGNPRPPSPLARKTIFTTAPAELHDAWTRTYSPSFRENGLNIYEWMLQYSRAESSLPVTLTNYRIVSADKQAVKIGWSTTAEQNNDYFSIERSTNGDNFSVIGKVAGTNLSSGSNYSFRDEQPAIGNNFYRLSQTDLNGKTTLYSILKSVIELQANGLVLFPNPASASVTVGFSHPDKDRLSVKIINHQGMVVQVNQFNKETGYWQQSIPTSHLSAGQYFIQVKGNTIEQVQSLVIKK